MKKKLPIIDLQNLCLEREIPILKNISWQVMQGEHWAILGANGSGKTSLLSALTAYLTPSSGKLSISGKEYGKDDWQKLRQSIGLVSSSVRQKIDHSETALETVISGKKAIINFWGKISSNEKKQALSILQKIECTSLAHRSWSHLSQGERQRILIGRALMAHPTLLILDEPCAGLDPVSREKFLSFLQRLASLRTAPTLILVTHHVEEIIPAFTHILLLKKGRVLASGKKLELMTSSLLSETFSSSVKVLKSKNRFTLQIKTKGTHLL